MIFETILGVGTILFLFILFTMLGHMIGTTTDSFNSTLTATRFNETVNQTMITSNFNLSNNLFYISLFFMTIVIFIWIVKKAVEYQRRNYYG